MQPYAPAASRAAPPLLIDQLGARLTAARSMAHLYEALTAKRDGRGGWPGGPSRDELSAMRDDERVHAGMLETAIRGVGGEPGEPTPRASVEAQSTRGIVEVIRDPRTLLPDAIDVAIVAELADREAWTCLIEIARAEGHDHLVAPLVAAQARDAAHLAALRRWSAARRAAVVAA